MSSLEHEILIYANNCCRSLGFPIITKKCSEEEIEKFEFPCSGDYVVPTLNKYFIIQVSYDLTWNLKWNKNIAVLAEIHIVDKEQKILQIWLIENLPILL